MNTREYARKMRVNEIANWLKEELEKGEDHERKKIISTITAKYNVARRTASDYLEASMIKNELG